MKEKEKEKELNLGNPTNTSDQPITSRAHFYPGSARLFQSYYVLMIFTIPRVVFGRIRNHSLDTYRISYYFGGTSSFFCCQLMQRTTSVVVDFLILTLQGINRVFVAMCSSQVLISVFPLSF